MRKGTSAKEKIEKIKTRAEETLTEETILIPKETERMHQVLKTGRIDNQGRPTSTNPHLRDKRKVEFDALNREIGKASVTRELNKQLTDNGTLLTKIVKSWINEAIKGNIQATQEILNRLDGKVAEVHRIDSENPITLLFAPAQSLLQPKQTITLEGAEPQKQLSTEQVVEAEEVKIKEFAPSNE